MPKPNPDPKTPAADSRRLLRWYRRHARNLPWRRTDDPYAIWISEIMLQQTTVEAVIPYFERWLRTLPDVQTLAAAPQDQVMKLWEGLGYYSRAVSLHKAAKVVVDERGGVFPVGEDAWRELPGIGPYTAAALGCIVDGQRVPAIDALVRRLLYRYLGLTGEGNSKANEAAMREYGARLLAKSAP
ncbi:A/G-specific adenine glycosylase, partial [bacterium]|nr:A/G-specific adenine glycosylase [bacterium]